MDYKNCKQLRYFLQKLNKFILDTLFPIRCLSCKKEGSWICENCLSQIETRNDHVCGVCEKVTTPDGRTCHACKKISPLDGLIVCSSYAQPRIVEAVHFFKYRFIPELHAPLGNLLVKSFKKTSLPLPDIIVPVPLHPRRLRWRGFNQSELLAKHIAMNLLPNFELDFNFKLLARNRYTPPQMSIKNFTSRQQNISGAFSLTATDEIKGKTVLLVDDIATTGSTIFECAKILKSAGAKEVFAIVIARQETKKSSK